MSIADSLNQGVFFSKAKELLTQRLAFEDIPSVSEHFIVDGDRAGPAAVASFLGLLQAQQSHHISLHSKPHICTAKSELRICGLCYLCCAL